MAYPWTNLSAAEDLAFDLAANGVYLDRTDLAPDRQADEVRDLLAVLADFELAAQPSHQRITAHSYPIFERGEADAALKAVMAMDRNRSSSGPEYEQIARILAGHVDKPALERAQYRQVFPIRVGPRRASSIRSPFDDLYAWLAEGHGSRVAPRALAAWLDAWHRKNTPGFAMRFR